MKKRSISIPYLLCFFLYIISRNAVYLAYTRDAIYYPVVLEPYINTVILLLICMMVCLTTGRIIGREITKKITAKSVITIIIIVTITVVQLWFLIEKAWNLDTEPFYLVVGLYLIALSWKQDFKGIVAVYTAAHAFVLAAAVLGLLLGYTEDAVKLVDYGAKHSFGMVHPNTAAHVIFLVVFCIWYLWLRDRRKLTFALFFLTGTALAIWNRCRTIIIILFLFPFIYELVQFLARKHKSILKKNLPFAPWAGLAVSLLLSLRMETVHRLMYGNFLRSFGERFVQAGIALKVYGLPLFGHSIDTSKSIRMVVDGDDIPLYVMDNAYVSYGIILGIIWLIAALVLFSISILIALNKGDIGFVVYGVFMCVFAVIERRGLDPAYNMMFIYGASMMGKNILALYKPDEENRKRDHRGQQYV